MEKKKNNSCSANDEYEDCYDNTEEAHPMPRQEPRHPTVKDLDPDQQPREKALKHGVGILSTADLWALILRTGTPGNPITALCRDIMRANDGKMHNLMRRSRKELMGIKGIGSTKAIQIEAVMELVRRYQNETIGQRPIIRQSKDIWEIMRHENGNKPHEEIWILLLNRRNEVTGKKCMTTGTMVASLFDVKGIVKEALLSGADGIILCHNHPSGNLRPSIPDDKITASLKKACDLLDLRMLDHVIVTTDGHYSYRDEGKL